MAQKSTAVISLQSKRDEIQASIKLYERQLAQARIDLAHVIAALRIFATSSDSAKALKYVSVLELFSRRERAAYCRAALAERGELTTKELAVEVMKRKGMDPGDKVLMNSVTRRLIHSLRMDAQKGRVVMMGKRAGVSLWKLPPDKDLFTSW